MQRSTRTRFAMTMTILWVATAALQAQANAPYVGKVLQTLEAGRYTYVQVDTSNEKIWAAAPTFTVKIGDTVTVPADMPMAPFESKTLGRTFDCVYFAGAIEVGGAGTATPQLPAGHPGVPGTATAPLPAGHPTLGAHGNVAAPAGIISGITKPEGGLSVAEIYAGKDTLTNQLVTVRGRVVKFGSQIMDRNWIHIQDGSGIDGTHDLTVTSDARAGVGDLVTVTGTLTVDRDFGYGYTYAVLIEKATLVVDEAVAPPAPLPPMLSTGSPPAPSPTPVRPWWQFWKP